jgi:acylpyruvate hydrolase
MVVCKYMRIGRFQANGQTRIGLFTNDGIRDVTDGYNSFQDALGRPDDAEDVDGEIYREDEIEYLPPTTERNTIFCAGVNYKAHAEEADMAVPERPLIFMKLPRSLVGHEEPIKYDTSVIDEMDYEAELAAVIGKSGQHIQADEALDHVAGYTILNDTSARDLQASLQVGDAELFDWFSGKAMQATTPVGPYVVANEIADPQNLNITSRVNGEVMQDDNTGLMIRSTAELISFISTRVELTPGDIIATGTPEGVGTFQDVELGEGDTVDVEIEGIGTLTNQVEEIN